MTAEIKAGIGAVAWVAFIVARVPDLRGEAWAHGLLLFAALVLVPLALGLFSEGQATAGAPERIMQAVARAQLPAALLLVVSCWLAPGPLAATAAIPWVALMFGLGVAGGWRVRRGGWQRGLDGLASDAALVFSAVGAVWTLMDRAGYRPMKFDGAIVTLTAVHFHYSGFLLPLAAGLVQRELFFMKLASQAVVGVVLGVPAVALGIMATQAGWPPGIEAGAGCGLALAGMAVGILQVRIAVESRRPAVTRLLLGVAGVSLFFGMVLAALYAIRSSVVLVPGLGIPQMRMLHGTLNAIGFGLGGVLAWRRMALPRG